MNLQSSVRLTSDGTLTSVDLPFPVFPEDDIQVFIGDDAVTSGFTFQRDTDPQRVVFDSPIEQHKVVIIRRVSSLSEIPHVFHYTGNIRGGAEFNSKNMDENFDKIRRAAQDAVDSLELVGVNVEAAFEAKQARDETVVARDIAIGAKNTAVQAASDAVISAGEASGYLQTVEDSANDANLAKTAAESARDSAISARNTSVSARDTAVTKAQEAQLSASSASGSANAAASSEQEAALHAEASSIRAGEALGSAQAAATSETNAATSETNALSYRNLAQAWASNPEDVPVEGGEFSAKHYMLKAKQVVDQEVFTIPGANTQITGVGSPEDPLKVDVVGMRTNTQNDERYLQGGNVTQSTGQSTTDVMSQKAVTDGLALKADTTGLGTAATSNVAQTTGQSTSAVMSQKAVTDAINSINSTPVGFVYTQYPGEAAPSALFGGTWSLLFSDEGVFFRTEGGNASAFGAGVQGMQIQSHTHGASAAAVGDHTHSVWTGEAGNHSHGVWYFSQQKGSNSLDGSILNGVSSTVTSAAGNHAHAAAMGGAGNHSHTITVNAAGGAETRPINRTIRVWKRTA